MQILKALFSGSKELGLSIVFLQLIHGLFKNSPLNLISSKALTSQVPETVFNLLPSQWKAPNGPVTQSEFSVIVHLGIDFYTAIRALLSKN